MILNVLFQMRNLQYEVVWHSTVQQIRKRVNV